MVLFGAGTRIAAIAGIAMLLAHGLFKAPLFLVTGIVDHATGTRDVRKLSGLRTSLRGSADHRGRGRGLDGRAAAAARLRRQGGRRSRRSSPRTTCAGRLVTARAGRGLGVHRRLQRPVPLGRVRAQARRRRHARAPARAAADRAGWALRGRRARARHREPRGRRRRAELRRRLATAGGRATTSRCGTASGCRCCSPPSRSGSATRSTAPRDGRTARRAPAARASPRSAPTSSPSAGPSGSRRRSPAACRSARSRPTSP